MGGLCIFRGRHTFRMNMHLRTDEEENDEKNTAPDLALDSDVYLACGWILWELVGEICIDVGFEIHDRYTSADLCRMCNNCTVSNSKKPTSKMSGLYVFD